MIDAAALTADLQRQIRALEDDLRTRADDVAVIRELVVAEWTAAHEAGRTAHDMETWREGYLTQVAVAWVLACVFVRFCEDNGLVAEPRLAGPGERGRHASNARMGFFADQPLEGDRGWLLHVFTQASALPGLAEVLGTHNPVWPFGPSDDAAARLLELFTKVDLDTGDLVHDFTDAAWDTRFLGDLYQDLSESARKTYALLQTPDFVEEFILDHTLDPAIEEFGLDGFRAIDPACGSGHFLLGMFGRLFRLWQARAPQDGDRALAERALGSVYGVDLNPFAASIARFRLLLAALKAAGVRTLAEAPRFTINVAVGDSLLHGPAPRQQSFRLVDEEDPATRHLFATEDAETIDRFLSQRYHAVVANPPYITPKDPAANDAYRRRYATCHRQYSLSVPFMERLFDLAERGTPDRPAGFVGQITANSFMKREFGKKLIEEYLANEVALTHVIDTSGAYIPGHGTPTVILFGRNRFPTGDAVRAVLGIRGEPERPTDPAKGLVWSSIVGLVDRPGSEDDFVSVNDLERSRLSGHPWSLQGGAAPQVMNVVERNSSARLSEVIEDMGRTAHAGEDDAFELTLDVARRRGMTRVVEWVQGEDVRDWSVSATSALVVPYSQSGEVLSELDDAELRWLWPNRARLGERKMYGRTLREIGGPWWQFGFFLGRRLGSTRKLSFANVVTHNHFASSTERLVFNSHAPVIKLPEGATEEEHLELVGLLNSSIACFWMKQVFHNKGNEGYQSGIKSENWERFYEFDGTKLKQFPVASGSALMWASALDGLAQELAAVLPTAAAEREVPAADLLSDARRRGAELRRRMVAVQEELDWRCLNLYGVTEEDLSLPPDAVPAIDRGLRAFEIVLARQLEAGNVVSEWLSRSGVAPQTELPADWPDGYRKLVERRIELIESDRLVNLAERPEYKRRWNWEDWDVLEERALRTWLLDRLEDPDYWPAPALQSVAQLADRARLDADFVQVAELYVGTPDVDLTKLIGELTRDEAVPFLAAWRYKDSGLRTRAAWERSWDLQRREDAGEEVGTIPVPPKYGSGDFRATSYWRLRGKLDVPKERFIAYPGAERTNDPTAVLGWAGWDHLQQAQALAGAYEDRRANQGWGVEKLVPLLAGVAEEVPWLQQWHNEVDPVHGERMGDFFAAYVDGEAHSLGVAPSDLAAWRPSAPTRGRRAGASR
jgi:hypothetical protein